MVNDIISRQAAIKAACTGFCHPGAYCPDQGCEELLPLLTVQAEDSRAIPIDWIEDFITRLRGESSGASRLMAESITQMLDCWQNSIGYTDLFRDDGK